MRERGLLAQKRDSSLEDAANKLSDYATPIKEVYSSPTTFLKARKRSGILKSSKSRDRSNSTGNQRESYSGLGVPVRLSNGSENALVKFEERQPMFHSNAERELLFDYADLLRAYDKKNNLTPIDESIYDLKTIATSLPDQSQINTDNQRIVQLTELIHHRQTENGKF